MDFQNSSELIYILVALIFLICKSQYHIYIVFNFRKLPAKPEFRSCNIKKCIAVSVNICTLKLYVVPFCVLELFLC